MVSVFCNIAPLVKFNLKGFIIVAYLLCFSITVLVNYTVFLIVFAMLFFNCIFIVVF